MKPYHLVLFVSVCAAAALAVPAATTAPTPAPKKTTAKKAVTTKKTASTKSGTSTKKTGKTATGKTKTAARTWQPRQQAPTPDRYREIQQALVSKGYLKSEPTGVWDAESVDALRQYQTDQKLTPTGKITSQSLIGLGLGPKTATSPLAPPPAATPPSPQP